MTQRHRSLLARLECGCPSPTGEFQEERLRVLRLQRALQAVGLGPRGRPRLAFALVKLLELDLMLVGLMARMHHGADPGVYVVFVQNLLLIGADKRSKVFDALTHHERERVAAAFAGTRASAEEVMRDVLAMPCEPASPMLGGIPLPLRDSDVEFLAATGWGTVLPWPRGA